MSTESSSFDIFEARVQAAIESSGLPERGVSEVRYYLAPRDVAAPVRIHSWIPRVGFEVTLASGDAFGPDALDALNAYEGAAFAMTPFGPSVRAGVTGVTPLMPWAALSLRAQAHPDDFYPTVAVEGPTPVLEELMMLTATAADRAISAGAR